MSCLHEGEYDLDAANAKNSPSACISEFKPMTDLDRRIAIGKDTPAPGSNQRSNAPARPLSFKAVRKKFAPANQVRG